MRFKNLLFGVFGSVLLGIGMPPPASAATTVTVYPNNIQGWSFATEQAGRSGPGTGTFVNGPLTPPAGSGSAQLTTVNASDTQMLAKAAYQGAKLADMNTLEYSTYQAATNTSPSDAIALQLSIDKDVTDTDNSSQGMLVYEPHKNTDGTVPHGEWLKWDAITAGNAKWWFSQPEKFNNTCAQAAPCTWNQLKAAFANIGIHKTSATSVIFKAGSGFNTFSGNVDAFNIGIGDTTTTYDLEATAPVIGAPTITLPSNNAVLVPNQPVKVDWNDIDGTDNNPIKYQYKSYSDPGYTNPVYDNVPTLMGSEMEIPTPSEGVYYIQVRAVDAQGQSAWSNDATNPYKFTVSSKPLAVDQCKNGGWKNYSNPEFASQPDCIASVTGGDTGIPGIPSNFFPNLFEQITSAIRRAFTFRF